MMVTMMTSGEMETCIVNIENLDILTENFDSVSDYENFYILCKEEQGGYTEKYEAWNKNGEKIVEGYDIEVIGNQIISVINEDRKYKLYNEEGEMFEGKEFDQVNNPNRHNNSENQTIGVYYLYRKILSEMK